MTSLTEMPEMPELPEALSLADDVSTNPWEFWV